MLDAIQKGFQTGGIPHTAPTRDPNAVIIPRPFAAQIRSVSGIKVDGSLDDWTGDPTFTLNDKSQLAYKLPPQVGPGRRIYQVRSGQVGVRMDCTSQSK